MTDRINAITVVLEKGTDSEHVDRLVDAIMMLGGVVDVKPNVADLSEAYIDEARIKRKLLEQILKFFNALDDGKTPPDHEGRARTDAPWEGWYIKSAHDAHRGPDKFALVVRVEHTNGQQKVIQTILNPDLGEVAYVNVETHGGAGGDRQTVVVTVEGKVDEDLTADQIEIQAEIDFRTGEFTEESLAEWVSAEEDKEEEEP